MHFFGVSWVVARVLLCDSVMLSAWEDIALWLLDCYSVARVFWDVAMVLLMWLLRCSEKLSVHCYAFLSVF